jgi:hypothetical protein
MYIAVLNLSFLAPKMGSKYGHVNIYARDFCIHNYNSFVVAG